MLRTMARRNAGGEDGLRHWRSPWVAGCYMSKKSDEGTAARRHLALTLLGHFCALPRSLATDRERQRTKALLGNFLTALEAVAVIALLEAHQRVVDLCSGSRLHLDEREL